MKYLILDRNIIDPKIIGGQVGDDELVCNEIYSLYNIICLEVGDVLYNTLRPTWWGKATEIDKDTAFYGAAFFSEIREVAKVYEAGSDGYPGVKKPVELTPEITAHVLMFMKKFAKEIIETEFEKRFFDMRDAAVLEAESWAIQKHEAQEFLNNPESSYTPFLDYLATERELDKEYLAQKILEKAEQYNDKLSEMLVYMQKILKDFERCDTIWDLNIQYEKYLGILMPTHQAREMGLTVSEEDWSRKDEVKVYQFNF